MSEQALYSGLIKIYQAAEMLSVSRGTIYHLIQRGKLHRVKIGKAARLRRADIQKMIDGPFRSNASASE